VPERNVLGHELEACCHDPETGFTRDGYCRYVPGDQGKHQICAVMTEEFLEFSRDRGNDLITPRPELDFPGLEPGDRWCLCVARWVEAEREDCAPPVVLEATSKAALDTVSLDTLRQYEHEPETTE
jgi:uncharacterized protein (DUF2237 family)